MAFLGKAEYLVKMMKYAMLVVWSIIENIMVRYCGLLLLICNVAFADEQSCETWQRDLGWCQQALDLPSLNAEPTSFVETAEQWLNYRYQWRYGLTVGAQTSARHFAKRSSDVGIAKQWGDSQLSLTVKNAGINWLGTVRGVGVNVHVGAEDDEKRPQFFMGFVKQW